MSRHTATCTTAGCDRPVFVRKSGLCHTCYHRDWHRRNPDKKAQYLTRQRVKRNAQPTHCLGGCGALLDWPTRRCGKPECDNAISRNKRMRKTLAQYGLTIEQYEAMAEAQGHRCAVCSRTRYLVVDHDHWTNEVGGTSDF